MEKQNKISDNQNKNTVYPIHLHKGEIISVIQNFSDKHGVWYTVSIVHENGNGHSLKLIHDDFENWLNKIIDAQNAFSKEYYEMILNNWDKIMKHLNDCIAWINAYTMKPKYIKGDLIKIVNYDGLEGKRDVVDNYCLSPFIGHYYILETFSIYQRQFIRFKENNLVSV
jgi:hypothetical protein